MWFDEAGVPRYDAFAPDDLANIYAHEAALAEVSCQGCGMRFKVALTDSFADAGLGLGDMIRLRRVRYGDPPNVVCCPGGPTMNSVMHAILEFWHKDHEVSFDWRRDPSCEGSVDGDQLEPADAVAAVLVTIAGGAARIRVACTSRQVRYALVSRLVAATPAGERVLLTCAEGVLALARWFLRGHVPDGDIGGWAEGRRVTLVPFERLPSEGDEPFDRVVVIAGSPPRRDGGPAWQAAAVRMAAAMRDGVGVELVLAHSAPMIEDPDVVVGAVLGAPSLP